MCMSNILLSVTSLYLCINISFTYYINSRACQPSSSNLGEFVWKRVSAKNGWKYAGFWCQELNQNVELLLCNFASESPKFNVFIKQFASWLLSCLFFVPLLPQPFGVTCTFDAWRFKPLLTTHSSLPSLWIVFCISTLCDPSSAVW